MHSGEQGAHGSADQRGPEHGSSTTSPPLETNQFASLVSRMRVSKMNFPFPHNEQRPFCNLDVTCSRMDSHDLLLTRTGGSVYVAFCVTVYQPNKQPHNAEPNSEPNGTDWEPNAGTNDKRSDILS